MSYSRSYYDRNRAAIILGVKLRRAGLPTPPMSELRRLAPSWEPRKCAPDGEAKRRERKRYYQRHRKAVIYANRCRALGAPVSMAEARRRINATP